MILVTPAPNHPSNWSTLYSHCVHHYPEITHFMHITPTAPPAPAPTREELVEAVVEAAVAWFNDEDASTRIRVRYAVNALIAHDEAAKAKSPK
jgi:hypothetical protein